MAEDLDKDLGDLGDLADLDLGGDATDSGEAEAGAAGESVELDADLQAMLNDSGGGDAPAADASGEGAGGGEDDVSVDDMLAEVGGSGGGGSAAPAQAPAARPAPPPATANLTEEQAVNLEFLLDIKLHVTFEVGRSKMLISDLLTLGQGSVIELHRLVGDELDLLVNGKLVAKGEVVVVNEKFGCKITDIIAPEDRVKHLGAI